MLWHHKEPRDLTKDVGGSERETKMKSGETEQED